MAEQTMFDEAANLSNESFLEKYVGEGKKYKDAEELAKAYEHANNHIPKLTEDLTSMRDFIAAQFEQINNERNNRQEPPVIQPVVDEGRQPVLATPPNGSGEEDLETRIAKILETRDETSRLQLNSQLTEEVMVNHFGSKAEAVEAVRIKAQELEVSPQFLADTAFRSPSAFFKIMGVEPDKKPSSNATPASSPDVNPRVLDTTSTSAKQGTYAFYDQLRRTDPKRYWSQSVQTQLHKDAQEKGQDFFKR